MRHVAGARYERIKSCQVDLGSGGHLWRARRRGATSWCCHGGASLISNTIHGFQARHRIKIEASHHDRGPSHDVLHSRGGKRFKSGGHSRRAQMTLIDIFRRNGRCESLKLSESMHRGGLSLVRSRLPVDFSPAYGHGQAASRGNVCRAPALSCLRGRRRRRRRRRRRTRRTRRTRRRRQVSSKISRNAPKWPKSE